ncbi:MAG: hypothetical protein QOH50_4789 [Kribbellaceae bacterium]|jgi:hypothetical protein|nr:hypothetical protein [Kribbellaceae bacterium]
MTDQYGGEPDRPGPYQGQGVFGSDPGQQPGGPGPYSGPGPFGQRPNPYAYQPVPTAPPRQVTVAMVICLVLGGFCAIFGAWALTASEADIAGLLPTVKGGTVTPRMLAVVGLLCAALYIVPALFLRKRRRWARIVVIAVAAFGIVGGLTSLPAGVLGLAAHVVLLSMLLQRPTKTWFLSDHR